MRSILSPISTVKEIADRAALLLAHHDYSAEHAVREALAIDSAILERMDRTARPDQNSML